MPKKKFSKTPVKTQEEEVTEPEKPTPKSKKPKKCSSETSVKTQEKEVNEQEKQAPKTKKPRNVIEEIFAENKRKRIEEEEKSEKEKKEAISKAKKMKKMKRRNEEAKEVGFVGQPSQPKKKTGDGLAIYTEEELGIGKEDAGVAFPTGGGSEEDSRRWGTDWRRMCSEKVDFFGLLGLYSRDKFIMRNNEEEEDSSFKSIFNNSKIRATMDDLQDTSSNFIFNVVLLRRPLFFIFC